MNQQVEKIWPDWAVTGFIDAGSYGRVYRVRKEQAGTIATAAVKIVEVPASKDEIGALMRSGWDSVSIFDHYAQEVQAIAGEISLMEQLKGHENIVHIEDFEVREHEDGSGWTICMRMELLTSLSSHLRSVGTMERDDIVRLGCDICRALEACERLGITHRDIKPSNVFIDKSGHYKLGDFGIAEHLDTAARRKNSEGAGTCAYMAPEVFFGRPADHTADIYSLGLVLYRLLDWVNQSSYAMGGSATARSQFWATEHDVEKERLNGKLLAPPTNTPERLARIVLRAVSPNPQDRYSTASEFRLALEAWSQKGTDEPEVSLRDRLESVLAQGKARFESGDYPKAVELLQQVYAAGYADAAAYLGRCYLGGLGVVRDARRGFDLLLEAANAGDPLGCLEVGRCYNAGLGVEQNASEAFAWYGRGSEAGSLEARLAAAQCLELGLGTAVDAEGALALYEQIARDVSAGALAQEAESRGQALRDALTPQEEGGLRGFFRRLFGFAPNGGGIGAGSTHNADSGNVASSASTAGRSSGEPVDAVETVVWDERSQRPCLLTIVWKATGRQFGLVDEGHSVSIGRYSTDIVLDTDNTRISRSHAKFAFDAGRVYIVDNNSSNGTYVNGSCIAANQWVPLKPGDTFSLADELFLVAGPVDKGAAEGVDP